eukprot:6479625-Amphidinium_carterae.2
MSKTRNFILVIVIHHTRARMKLSHACTKHVEHTQQHSCDSDAEHQSAYETLTRMLHATQHVEDAQLHSKNLVIQNHHMKALLFLRACLPAHLATLAQRQAQPSGGTYCHIV